VVERVHRARHEASGIDREAAGAVLVAREELEVNRAGGAEGLAGLSARDTAKVL
jgi:hypothetical protein